MSTPRLSAVRAQIVSLLVEADAPVSTTEDLLNRGRTQALVVHRRRGGVPRPGGGYPQRLLAGVCGATPGGRVMPMHAVGAEPVAAALGWWAIRPWQRFGGGCAEEQR